MFIFYNVNIDSFQKFHQTAHSDITKDNKFTRREKEEEKQEVDI